MLTIEERRNFYRMMVDAAVSVKVPNQASLHGKCLDLSATGMGVLVSDPVELGTQVEAMLESADRLVPPLHAQARVVRCSAQGDGSWQLGLEIIEMR